MRRSWRELPLESVVTDLLEFPLWWYTRGIRRFAQMFFSPVLFLAQYFALPVLVVNLGQPLYGDFTWKGRILSFFVRIGHLLVLSSGIAIIGLFLVFAYALWMLLPLMSVAQMFRLFVEFVLPG